MLYSETLLNIDALSEPAKEALLKFAGQTVNLNHAAGAVALPDDDALMEYEKRMLLANNPRTDLYRIPAQGEKMSDVTQRAALDYQHSPELQAEFPDVETYQAYRRHEKDARIFDRANATIIGC